VAPPEPPIVQPEDGSLVIVDVKVGEAIVYPSDETSYGLWGFTSVRVGYSIDVQVKNIGENRTSLYGVRVESVLDDGKNITIGSSHFRKNVIEPNETLWISNLHKSSEMTYDNKMPGEVSIVYNGRVLDNETFVGNLTDGTRFMYRDL